MFLKFFWLYGTMITIIIIIITMGKFTDVLLSQSSIIWYWSRGGHTVWLDNHRSGVVLAMHHRLKWFISLQVYGLRKGDEHSTYTLYGVWHIGTLPLPFTWYIPLCLLLWLYLNNFITSTVQLICRVVHKWPLATVNQIMPNTSRSSVAMHIQGYDWWDLFVLILLSFTIEFVSCFKGASIRQPCR